MAITINGRKVKVLASYGFQPSVGEYAKRVLIDGKEEMAVGGPGGWRLWTAEDRTAPLREARAKGWPKPGWDRR